LRDNFEFTAKPTQCALLYKITLLHFLKALSFPAHLTMPQRCVISLWHDWLCLTAQLHDARFICLLVTIWILISTYLGLV